jgi:hypothetical protein
MIGNVYGWYFWEFFFKFRGEFYSEQKENHRSPKMVSNQLNALICG